MLHQDVRTRLYPSLVQHEKAAKFLEILKSFFFVRHSSEYETSDSDRKVIHNLYSQMQIHMVR